MAVKERSRLWGIEGEDIQVTTTYAEEKGKIYEVHYYHRFIRPKTEIWTFGAGLGDLTLMRQFGDSFFEYVDKHGDPELGRLMFSMGSNATARMPYKGDLNIWWPWNCTASNLIEVYGEMNVKPDLVISPWESIKQTCSDNGIYHRHFLVGVGRRFFKPLYMKREGMGHAGLDHKSERQKHCVLGPALKRNDFEWISKTPETAMLTIDELNKWYNSKKILFGMIEEHRQDTGFVPSRFMETLASGTPLITWKLYRVNEMVGIDYPYMTESFEQTEFHIEQILENYDKVSRYIHGLSDLIRREHTYVKRFEYLFPILRELL